MSVYAILELKDLGFQDLPAEMDPNREGLGYGQNIPQMYQRLDALAEAAGVPKITSFFYDAELLSADLREEFGMPPVDPRWMPVEQGVLTVRALIAALKAERASDGELWDLQACERILQAAPSGTMFRFWVG